MNMNTERYIHNKTGHIYFLIAKDVINATNAQAEQIMCLYTNTDNMLFVREQTEFFNKFTKEDTYGNKK